MHSRSLRITLPAAVALLCIGSGAGAQPAAPSPPADPRLDALEKKIEALDYRFDQIQKGIDDVLWFERVGDVADIDKVFIPTVPNPKAKEIYGIKNERHPLKIWSYVFVPKKLDRARKAPLLILPHGGVHADFTTYHTHIIRELMSQGYVVVAPEYRGSTG